MTKHIILHEGGAKCLHCEATFVVQLPVRVDDWVTAMNGFIKNHEGCKENVHHGV